MKLKGGLAATALALSLAAPAFAGQASYGGMGVPQTLAPGASASVQIGSMDSSCPGAPYLVQAESYVTIYNPSHRKVAYEADNPSPGAGGLVAIIEGSYNATNWGVNYVAPKGLTTVVMPGLYANFPDAPGAAATCFGYTPFTVTIKNLDARQSIGYMVAGFLTKIPLTTGELGGGIFE